MSVYVDDMAAKFRSMTMSHMVADTPKELHAMADAIGLRRCYLQGANTWKEHYDVSLGMKVRAINLGARQITQMELGRMLVDRARSTRA